MNSNKNNNFNPSSIKSNQDIDGMLVDSGLRVLQGNYSYIGWSILGISIALITFNIMKK